MLGLGHAMIARELRAAEWSHWHLSEGHSYYDRAPKKPRHLRGLSRLDHYILLRIRSGTGVVGHDECPGVDNRFHLVSCDKYLLKRPRFPTLFNDKRVPEWRDWWQSHFNLGLGIPSEHKDNDGVVTVCGNPFQRTVTQLVNGTLSLFHLGAPDSRCTRCLLKSCNGSDKCLLPLKFTGGGGRTVALTWWPDTGPCGKCGNKANRVRFHLGRSHDCALSYFMPFWDNIMTRWDDLPVIDRNTTVLQWWSSQPGLCVCDWTPPDVLTNHLRQRGGQSCLEHIVHMFEQWMRDGGRPVLVDMNVVWRRG